MVSWTSEDDLLLSEQWNSGKRITDIAYDMKKSRSQIYVRLYELGLTMRDKPSKTKKPYHRNNIAKSSLPISIFNDKNCLKCHNKFKSYGKWNHLCRLCANKNSHASEYDLYCGSNNVGDLCQI